MIEALFWLVLLYLLVGVIVIVVYKNETPDRFRLLLTWPWFLAKR